MIRNFISREANIVLKIYKTQIRHIEYWTQAWAPVSRHRNWGGILGLKGYTKKIDKIMKWVEY